MLPWAKTDTYTQMHAQKLNCSLCLKLHCKDIFLVFETTRSRLTWKPFDTVEVFVFVREEEIDGIV